MYRVLFRSFLKINFHYESDRRYFIFQHQSAWNENWNRFFFYLRKENGGSGVLINVIVNSIDNSNLPVVCRYCRLIIFFTNVETFWYIQLKCVYNLIQQKLSTYCKRFRFDSCWRKTACSSSFLSTFTYDVIATGRI